MGIRFMWIGKWLTLMFTLVFSPMLTLSQFEEETERLALQVHEQQITLYAVSPAGEFRLLRTLTDINMLSPTNQIKTTAWNVIMPDTVKVSPDRQYVAFTAFDMKEVTKAALFVYSIADTTMTEIAIPGMADIVWSPHSDEFLLVNPWFISGGDTSTPVIRGVYRFDLATHNLTPLILEGNHFFSNFLWLPDGEQIVFVNSFEECAVDACIEARNLYWIDFAGQGPHRLTNLGITIPLELHGSKQFVDYQMDRFIGCQAANLVWSEEQQRIYFTVNCMPATEFNYTSLYSVDLDGSSRLEFEVSALFPDDRANYIVDVYPDTAGHQVYAILEGHTITGNEWRIVKGGVSNPYSLVVMNSAENTIDTSLSIDRRVIAISGRAGHKTGFVSTVNLDTGEITTLESPRSICFVDWIRRSDLIYTEFEEGCTLFAAPVTTLIWDTITTVTEPISQDLDGWVWVLPRQR